MSVEQRIGDLIKAGWGVLEPDFDPRAFQHWRRSAFDCLNAMFGPDHVYTRHFENLVRQGGKTNLLAAGGILIAAKEQAVLQRPVADQSPWQRERLSPGTENIGGSMNRRAI